jgi:cyclopropane fatty-acyl-phospholipid synthase-like methyltransferase
LKTILDSLELNFPKAKLLDIGCGDGRNTLKYVAKIGIRNFYGIEIVDDQKSGFFSTADETTH